MEIQKGSVVKLLVDRGGLKDGDKVLVQRTGIFTAIVHDHTSGISLPFTSQTCEIVLPAGKQTLKRYIKYLILLWLKGKSEFNGLELIRYVQKRTNKPDMYANTVIRYLWELRREGKLNYETISRQKSQYKADNVSSADGYLNQF